MSNEFYSGKELFDQLNSILNPVAGSGNDSNLYLVITGYDTPLAVDSPTLKKAISEAALKTTGRIIGTEAIDEIIDIILKENYCSTPLDYPVSEKSLQPERKSQADQLYDEIRPKIEVYHDSLGNGYYSIPVGDGVRHYRIGTQASNQFLRKTYRSKTQKTLTPDALRQASSQLEADAVLDGPEYSLSPRVNSDNEAIYYDLCDGTGHAVKITPEGISLTAPPYPMFSILPIRLPQAEPKPGGNIHDLLKYFRVPEYQLLFLVYVIFQFVPQMPKPRFQKI